MNKLLKTVAVCLAGLVMHPTTAAERIRYAIFPAPPFMISTSNNAEQPTGIDVEIAQEIARRLKVELSFVRAPWVRCLRLMQTGDADLISSAYKTPEREAYMAYFSKPFLQSLPVAFYFKKGAKISIVQYEDIYQYGEIGVLKGAEYFKRFDQDDQVKKVAISTQDQLFPMLTAGRFRLMAGYVDTENYRLMTEGYLGKVERSSYIFSEPAQVFMALSKQSPWAARIAEIDAINNALIREGFIQRVVEKYRDKYNPGSRVGRAIAPR